MLEMLQLAASNYESMMDLVMDSSPMTIVHLDARQGNCFFREGVVKLFDWQSVSLGAPAMDLAYTLSGSLSINERREWQEELIKIYFEHFQQLSGCPYSLGELREAYAKALLWPLLWAAVTLADLEGTVDHCAGPALEPQQDPVAATKRDRARETARDFVVVGTERYLRAALDESGEYLRRLKGVQCTGRDEIAKDHEVE